MVVNIQFDNGNGTIRGDQFSRTFIVTDIPAGVVISGARLTVKNDLSVADGSALFKKSITTSLTADGQIEDDGTGSGIGKCRFSILSADTQALSADTMYWYDFQVVLDSGDIFTLAKGHIVMGEEVTKTNS
jgi:hypothetical protein